MYVADWRCLAVTPLAVSIVLSQANVLPAYVGPGAGLELSSYFLGLLVWVALALGAILLWPLYLVVARIRRARAKEPAEIDLGPADDGTDPWA